MGVIPSEILAVRTQSGICFLSCYERGFTLDRFTRCRIPRYVHHRNIILLAEGLEGNQHRSFQSVAGYVAEDDVTGCCRKDDE